MAQRNGDDQIHWSYFINPDKSAAPVFDKLCRGIVQIIVSLQEHQEGIRCARKLILHSAATS